MGNVKIILRYRKFLLPLLALRYYLCATCNNVLLSLNPIHEKNHVPFT